MKRTLYPFLLALVLLASLLSPALAAGNGFRDVSESHWASEYIQRAYEADWIHGMGDGRYDPSGNLSRAQFLTMVTNAFFSGETDRVSVPEGSPWYAACWSVAQENGLHTGTAMQGLGDLNGKISRYDMAQVIVNTLSGQGISASAEEARSAQSEIKDWDSVPAGYRDAVSGAYALGILSGRSGKFDGQALMTRAEAAKVLCGMDGAISGGQTDTTPQEPDQSTQKPDNTTQTPDNTTQKPSTTASTPEELAAEVVRLVNVERSKEGLSPLGTFDSLTQAAQIRAPEVGVLFSHDRPDGTSCFTALDQTGAKKGAYTWGENIAAGNATAAETVEQWMNSPGHRANILNPKYTHIGVGYCYDATSTYRHNWVQMFVGTNSTPDGDSAQTPPSTPEKPNTPPQTPGGAPSVPGETGGLQFSCPIITLDPGNSYMISVLDDAFRLVSDGVTWTNESPELLRLSGDGSSVTAIGSSGTGYLSVSRGGETARLTVRIIPTVNQVTLSCLSTTMSPGGYGTAELYIFSTSRFYGQDCSVAWSVDDPSVLTLDERVSSQGNPSVHFQAMKAGDARITCQVTMADGSSAEAYCFVHVR